MKTYEITIKPTSGFGTLLKGDTIFGHLCWQAKYDSALFGTSLSDLLQSYKEQPFLVVSSAFPKIIHNNRLSYVLPRPTMPMSMLFVSSEELKDRKALKARTWMLLEENKPLDSFGSAEYVKEQDISGKIRRESCRIVEIFDQPHNTINRLTSTTGTGRFAPFSVEQIVYLPEIELAIFVVAQTAISADNIRTAFERIGAVGFGKDASTGLGRFLVLGIKEINLFSLGSSTPNACYTLAPCVPPRSETWLNAFFSVVTRFGKHGDALAKSGKPFKNPVIMADDGAVFVSSDNQSIFEKPFFGSAITDVSKIEPATVTQGYAPYIPVKIGGE